MTDKYQALRSAVPLATQGKWIVHPIKAHVIPTLNLDVPIASLLWPTKLRSEDETFSNATYIAAANPATIAALLADYDALLKALQHIECEPINAEYMARAAIDAARGKS